MKSLVLRLMSRICCISYWHSLILESTYDSCTSIIGLVIDVNEPLPDELALAGKSASQMLSQILNAEHSNRTFKVIVRGMSVSVIWTIAFAGRCLIFDISSTHSTAVSGMVVGMFTRLHTSWKKSEVCCWHLKDNTSLSFIAAFLANNISVGLMKVSYQKYGSLSSFWDVSFHLFAACA